MKLFSIQSLVPTGDLAKYFYAPPTIVGNTYGMKLFTIQSLVPTGELAKYFYAPPRIVGNMYS